MKRSTLLLCWAAAWAAAVLTPAPALAGSSDALKYDPSASIAQANMLRIYVKTRVCMVDGSVAMLRQGARSRERVESFTLAVCGNPLRVELVTNGGFSDEDAATMLHSLATSSLNEVLAR